MSVTVGTGRRPMHVGLLAVVGTAIVAVACAALVLDAWRGGLRYGGTSIPLLVALPAAVCATATAAWWLAERAAKTPARWMGVTSGALLFYLASTAAAAQYAGLRGERGIAADLLVAAHGVGAIVPIAALQLCFLATLTGLAGPTSVVRRFRAVLLALTALYLAAGSLFITPGSPYDDMRPIWDVMPMEVATVTVGTAIWIATVLVGPVIVWRGAARSRGDVRRRLSLLAACAMAPVVTVTFCILGMIMVQPTGLMSALAGESVLAVAYCVPFLVASVAVPAVMHPQLMQRSPELLPRVVAGTVTAIVSALFGIVVITASALIGARLGADRLLAIVVLTLLVAAALSPVRARFSRRLALSIDPARAAAARLLAELDDQGWAHPAASAQAILCTSLADPTAQLVIELPDRQGWVNVESEPVPAPSVVASTARVGRSGSAGRVVHSGSAGDAGGVVVELQPLIDRAVLEVTVREQSRRIAAEKDRADAAASAERLRLSRDLHDGLQGRLLALALDLQMAQRELADGEAQLVLSDATDRLQNAIGELRTLASGASPEMLSREGLGAALAELTARVPVPVTVAVPSRRLSAPVETVAYLVVCEAVTNALKHAGAEAIDIRVATDGRTASIEVNDNGRGGADMRAGTGLRGMSERVGAAGGQMIVSDRQPRGTTIEVILPCES